MEKTDDYICGPHHYCPHFICGFIFGAFVGASLVGWLFDSLIATWVAAAISGLCFGYSCGKWGERSWKSISEWFSVWWRAL
jgi:hypothetical protein